MQNKLKELRETLLSLQKAKTSAEVELRQAKETLTQIQQQCAQLGYASPEEAEAALTAQLDQMAKQIGQYAALL